MQNRFKIIKLDEKYISPHSRDRFESAAKDLIFLKEVFELEEICIRGGFIIDTLKGKEPKDIDLFYVLRGKDNKPLVKCECEKLNVEYLKIKNKLSIKDYDIDWGHYGTGETYQPVIQGICGYYTQSVDFLSLFVLDENGDIWTNEYGQNCLVNGIWEITPMTWMTYIYFMADEKVDFYELYCGIALKGILHIYEGKARSVGPMYRELLENLPLALSQISPSTNGGRSFKGRFSKRFLGVVDIQRTLKKLKIKNTDEIVGELERLTN